MSYIDVFLLPIKKENLDAYRKISEDAGKIWMEHGALAYKECMMDDDAPEMMASFIKTSGAGDGETVIASYILYKSRAHRNEVNAKVMADERIKCDKDHMPFEINRMSYGGFEAFVDF